MKKFLIQSLALVAVILFALYFTFNSSASLSLGGLVSGHPTSNTQNNSTTSNKTKQVKIGNNVINVEVVDSQESRSKGLSGRDSLDQNSGMLFVFQNKGTYQFWMKDMKIGLDFIFISDAKVTDLIKNVPPPTDPNHLNIYQPSVPGNLVLEVNSGYIDKHKINVGDSVSLISN